MDHKVYQLVILKGEKSQVTAWTQEAINSFNCDGVEEFSMEEAEVDKLLGERAYSGGNLPNEVIAEVENFTKGEEQQLVKLFFYQGKAWENAMSFCGLLRNEKIECRHLELPWEDWNAEWRKYFTTIEVGDDLRVIPEWEKESAVRPGDILIYPGMGFGTGHHETTYLCLEAFERLRKKGRRFSRVLDFGCGSGILGVAALKKLPRIYCEFCDIDREALNNCQENLLLNFSREELENQRLVSRLNFAKEKSRRFDLVFANILGPVLLEEKELLQNRLTKNGILIVSGILTDQVDSIKNAYADLVMHEENYQGEWSCLVFESV